MDPRLLDYYNRELQYVREMGGEFAREYPKIAGRLGLEEFECADPYVERLLEGFAFLTARVQLKIDSEFPRFTQHLLEMVYPHFLAPTPSMAVVQCQPDLSEGALAEGFPLPRDTVLRSIIGKDEPTRCEYRTAHEVVLWPIELVGVEYFGNAAAISSLDVPETRGTKAAIRLRLRTTAGLTFDKIALDRLPLFLRGPEDLPVRIYEQFMANGLAVVARSTERPVAWQVLRDKSHIRSLGFEDEQALLPFGPQSFQGYRLLQEYFAFPQRFLFVELAGLGEAVRRCKGTDLELVILLNRVDPKVETSIDAGSFALFSTPAVNLFPVRADRIHLSDKTSEFHVVPDRTRPLDLEVYRVTQALGYGTSVDPEQEFLPFYASKDLARYHEHSAYYTTYRLPRMLSSKQRRQGTRTSYHGSEVFVSLVDPNEAPYRSSLRQLALTTLCTNRDLPLLMPVGKTRTDFELASGAPVNAVRCVAGPSKPRPAFTGGDTVWRLISHLSLNYLSLVDNDPRQGAAALREILRLYAPVAETPVQRQIDGIRSISTQPIVRRVSSSPRVAFGRGLEVALTCEEAAFEGSGVFLIGGVLERFFAKYVSINSFTEMVLGTVERGEVHRWPARIGRRHTL